MFALAIRIVLRQKILLSRLFDYRKNMAIN